MKLGRALAGFAAVVALVIGLVAGMMIGNNSQENPEKGLTRVRAANGASILAVQSEGEYYAVGYVDSLGRNRFDFTSMVAFTLHRSEDRGIKKALEELGGALPAPQAISVVDSSDAF